MFYTMQIEGIAVCDLSTMLTLPTLDREQVGLTHHVYSTSNKALLILKSEYISREFKQQNSSLSKERRNNPTGYVSAKILNEDKSN